MKSTTAGSEIDAWCTRCKMMLGHRVIAMHENRPARVICLTCESQHNFRASAPQKDSAALVVRGRDGSVTPLRRAGERSSTPPARTSAKQKRADLMQNEWEAKIAGQPANSFTRYSMTRVFEVGQLISHPKFGDGYVLEVIDRAKVNVLFSTGPRTLAHGQTP